MCMLYAAQTSIIDPPCDVDLMRVKSTDVRRERLCKDPISSGEYGGGSIWMIKGY